MKKKNKDNQLGSELMMDIEEMKKLPGYKMIQNQKAKNRWGKLAKNQKKLTLLRSITKIHSKTKFTMEVKRLVKLKRLKDKKKLIEKFIFPKKAKEPEV